MIEDIARIIVRVVKLYSEGDSILQLVEDVSNELRFSFDSHRNSLIVVMLEDDQESASNWAVNVLG